MSFLLSVLSLFQTVNTHVIWKNDVLTLPISSALHDYQYLPEASLFDDDGHEQIDPHRFYEYGVDRTFLSVVNTHVVRDYHIKYRVHFPTYQIISTKTIVFSVIDDVPPIILSIPSFRIPLNQKMPNLLEGIVYFDNYYDNEFLTVTVQSHQVVLNKVGIYEIIYQVTDQSGNKTAKTSYVEVYDHLPPDIIQKKDMVLSFGTSFLWQDYFTIKDNFSLVLNIDINDALVDYTMLGTYPIEITATDESGLSSRTHQNLIIIDDKKPSIQLRSNPRDLSVNQDLDRAVFLEYVLAVSDNYDVLSVDELLISDDIEIDVPGDYFVYYTLIDRSGNIREEKLKIKVVDDIKPTIELIKPLAFEVFETHPFLDEYVYFYDNYTHEMDLVLKITSGLKMQTIGQYPVIFEVTDQANNKATLSTYVKIVDLTPPIILQQNDIIITDFSRKSLSHYFQVSDNYDVPSLVELYIDDSEVEYEKIGAYPLVVTATDSSGNLTFYESEIMVIDLIEPVISLTQTTLYLQVNQQEIDPADYLLYVHDNYDYLTEQDVIITHD
ncbi:MAG: hypothetical protein IH571_00235, partial [Acholeplasmataceae bacterium]|nr:hypothetical protein [Acholeplasmataceae bacterium]